jgi:hypothetical protein
MNAFPPLDVRVEGARLSCILDLRLALSRYGLMLAWRLSRELDVWLYRSFWALLDDAELYLREPDALLGGIAGGFGPPLDLGAATEALAQWEPARLEDNVPSFPFYYVGDLRYESRLPPGTDAGLIDRFERLAAALHARAADTAPAGLEPQLDCWRDAAALHGALAHARPLILTVREEHDAPPALCRFLAHAGVDCHRLDWPAAEHPMRNHLLPVLIRTGAAELLWAGLPLAAVHLVAPRAFALPRHDDDDSADDDFADQRGRRRWPVPPPPQGTARPDMTDPWQHAVCIWYALR